MAELRVYRANAKVGPTVLWCEGQECLTLPALWLRTRSNVAHERDSGTRQRLYDPHRLPSNLRLTDARIEDSHLYTTFSDGLIARFEIQSLLTDLILSEEIPDPKPWDMQTWDSTHKLPNHQWPELTEKKLFFSALQDFIHWGFLILHNTPCERNGILQVARHFGYPRETNFNLFFEVYSRPESHSVSDDLAYRAIALGPHTDNPYRDPVPGIQLLQCLYNATTGGLSTLVDSLAVCARLKEENPYSYALLTEVPVRFAYRGGNTELVQVCPIIELNGSGQMIGMHYSPRLSDIPFMSETKTRAFHSACYRLAELLEDPLYELQLLLAPSDLIMFDNNRILHGRTAFNPNEGLRQLQGCYIDRDMPRSHYRVLRRYLENQKI